MTVMQSPILQQFGALIVSLQHCYFKGVEFLPVHGLHCAQLKQVLDYFHVAVCSCVVEHGVVGVVSAVVANGRVEEVEEAVVLVVSDGQHQRGASEIIRLGVVLFISQKF